MLSEQRARVAGSGIQFTGSPLIMASADMKEYYEDMMWMEKGIYSKAMADNAEAAGLIASETYKMGSTLLQAGIGYNTYTTNKKIAETKGIG